MHTLQYRLSHKMMLFLGTNTGFYVFQAPWLILTNDKVINPNIDANIITFLSLKAFKLHAGYVQCALFN